MTIYTVAPIGTCRLNSPLRRGAVRHGFKISDGRNYGYTHTSTEALQQLRFMLGEHDIPDNLVPLICRNSMTVPVTAAHERSDLYFVEISSAKSLTCEGWATQLNYVSRHFADFLSDKARAKWFWRLATEETSDELQRRLYAEPAFLRLSNEDQRRLANLRMKAFDPEQLHRDINGIADRLGKDRMVLVTHVDAQTPDGDIIASRSKLIAQVISCAEANGIRYYDPTSAMKIMGQEHAMEKDGLDTTHYTDAFADVLCNDFQAQFMPKNPVAITGSTKEQQAIPLLNRIEDQWERGDFRAAFREVRARVASDDETIGLQKLYGRMVFETGDYEAALNAFDIARDKPGSDYDTERMRMVSAHKLGLHELALRIGEGMLGDETETEEIVEICARSAYAVGRLEASIEYWKRLFWLGDGHAEAATEALNVLSGHDITQARLWRDTVLDKIPHHCEALKHLWSDLVSVHDRTRLLASVPAFAMMAPDDLIDMVGISSELMPLASARLIEAYTSRLDDQSDASSRLRAIAFDLGEQWGKLAQERETNGQPLEAVEPLQAAFAVNPVGGKLVQLLRSVTRTLRMEARAAAAIHDNQRALDICNECMATGFGFAGLQNLLGRALLGLDRPDEGIVYLRAEAETAEDQPAAWYYVQRSAVLAGLYADAMEAGVRVQAAGGPVAEAATKLLASIKSRAMRDVRRMSADGEFEKAWRLTGGMIKMTPNEPAVLRERMLILRTLRNVINQSDGDSRLEAARRLLALQPNDRGALRAAAIATMRTFEFRESLDLWVRLRETADGNAFDAKIEININKCRLFIDRADRRAHPLKVAA